MSTPFNKKIGKVIKAKREELGKSRNDVVVEIENMNVDYLRRCESGYHDIRTSTLYKIAKAMNITISELLAGLK